MIDMSVNIYSEYSMDEGPSSRFIHGVCWAINEGTRSWIIV